jgi:hypothetical protein
MNTGALITMVLTQGIVTLCSIFFYKVLTIPPRQEPDSSVKMMRKKLDKMLKINNYLYI